MNRSLLFEGTELIWSKKQVEISKCTICDRILTISHQRLMIFAVGSFPSSNADLTLEHFPSPHQLQRDLCNYYFGAPTSSRILLHIFLWIWPPDRTVLTGHPLWKIGKGGGILLYIQCCGNSQTWRSLNGKLSALLVIKTDNYTLINVYFIIIMQLDTTPTYWNNHVVVYCRSQEASGVSFHWFF